MRPKQLGDIENFGIHIRTILSPKPYSKALWWLVHCWVWQQCAFLCTFRVQEIIGVWCILIDSFADLSS